MSAKKRRRYDSNFKREAVNLHRSSGKSCLRVEKDLGISHGLLKRWIREFGLDSENAFRGNGKMRPDEFAFKQLQRELTHVKRERDILKKAVAIFSKEPNKYLGL